MIRKLFLALIAIILIVLALIGHAQQAMYLAMALTVSEILSLFAPEMLYIAAATELDDRRRAGQWNLAFLLALVGAGLAVGLTYMIGVGCSAAAAYMPARVLLEKFRLRIGMRFAVSGSLFRGLPEALLLRGICMIPATALLIGAWYGWGINTVLPFAAGLLAFGLLRVENRPVGAETERFGARWVFGAILTAACVLTAWNGVFSAVYCAWAVVAALIPVIADGKARLCCVLVVLQAVCGAAGVWFGMSLAGGAAALALALVIAAVQRGAIYAASLPLRAWLIRRRVK